MNNTIPKGRAVVVGASLAGLCSAVALARAGWSVTVLERSRSPLTGMGLSIDFDLLQSITGVGRDQVPTIDNGYSFTGWGLAHSALLSQASAHPSITLQTGITVHGAVDDSRSSGAMVQTSTGNVAADLVVGADGYNSVVRRAVAPGNPTSIYAGFVLWRGLINERALARGFGKRPGIDIENGPDDVLATFPIPGEDGSTRAGHRRGVFVWFDASKNDELHTARRIDNDHVLGTWQGRTVPSKVINGLQDRARRWSSPWRDAIAASIRDRQFIGTPVAEYLPTRLATGSVALVGDAAHVVSPVTGAGFHNGMLDVQALVRALTSNTVNGVAGALQQYDRERLPLARALVAESRAWSNRFAAGIVRYIWEL
jgi:2-polyprenyl-6-methoxyphenol hydroxylase-like FAD-dependent oxidoreductase